MAPQKRPRLADDDHDVTLTDQASSNFRVESGKRPRLENPGERRTSTAVSSEGEDEPVEPPISADADANLLPSTQYEIERDAGFKHLQNEERDDERATQAIMARNQALGENRPAENGIIESVTCVNFMCHERMHVDLGPLINFIVGANGSGKSAILTGIALCLGGKASMTNRGGSLKSFVKEGREHASLTVKIANRGVDAYQPDLYGESIIVERHFSKSGTSGFKLKTSTGKVISTKKSDVEDIIEHFQMQIDNPMNILTQDAAKQFLNHSTPAQKYKFFVRGVQLEQLDNDYKLLRETTDNILEKIYLQKDNVTVLEDIKNAAEEKRKLIAKHESMRNRVRELARQSAWAQVEEQERALENRERVVLEKQAAVEQAERHAEEESVKYQQTIDHSRRAEEALESCKTELIPLLEEQVEKKAVFDENTKELHETLATNRQVRELMRTTKLKIDNTKSDITAEQQRLTNANGGVHTKLLADLEAAKNKVAKAKTELGANTEELPELKRRLQVAEEALAKTRGPISEKQADIRACEKQIQDFSRTRTDVMAGFDRNVPRLLTWIKQESRFREKPIGPVGLHIRLLQPVWSTILETQMGRLLSSYIVTSSQDRNLLSSKIDEMGIKDCNIYIANNHPLSTDGFEPDPQYNTVLRVIEIDNDLVRKQLIINQSIEQTVLIEDRQTAVNAMSEGARPANVKQCYTVNTDKRGWGLRLGFGFGGDVNSSPISGDLTRRPRMATDVDSQIAFKQGTLRQLKEDLRNLENVQLQSQQVLDRCGQDINQHTSRKSNLIVALQRAEDHFDNLRENLNRNEAPPNGKLESFQDDLREQQREMSQHEGTFQETIIAKERLNKAAVKLKKDLQEVEGRIEDHQNKITKATKKFSMSEQARVLALQQKNSAYDSIDDAKKDKESVEKKRDVNVKTVQHFNEQANTVSARVPIDAGETPDSLDHKLEVLQKRIKEYSKQAGGSDEEINNAASEAIQNWRAAVKEVESMEQMCDLLKETFENRQQRWRKFQQLISARSRIMFVYLLSERGFRGKLMIDHKSQLLDLNVEPDETTKSNRGRQTKTLSGGEKSFSSICLLLALWEAMGAPLRCLDEFDVFMDQVNRDVSTKMIVSNTTSELCG